MCVHAFYFWNSGSLKLIPYRRGPIGTHVIRVIVGRHCRYCTGNHWIISMHKCFNPYCRFRALSAGIISGPFPQRSFHYLVINVDETLKCDFRAGRYRQTRGRHINNLHRFTKYTADYFEFIFFIRHFKATDHEHYWMNPGHNGNGAFFATIMVFFHY